jgi:hypothetical protein
MQYMCQPATDFTSTSFDRLRDGTNTNSQDHVRIGTGNNVPNEELTQAAYLERKRRSVNLNRVMQESWENYDNCYYRSRNAGLFTADQNLKNNERGYSSAIFTRQNANGGIHLFYIMCYSVILFMHKCVMIYQIVDKISKSYWAFFC